MSFKFKLVKKAGMIILFQVLFNLWKKIFSDWENIDTLKRGKVRINYRYHT